MKNNEPPSESDLLDGLFIALAETLGGTAHLEAAEMGMQPRGIDALIDVNVEGMRLRLVVEAKRNAFPRDVREAAWRLRNLSRHVEIPQLQTIPMVIAPVLSPGARAFLREQRIGYYDAGGSLFLPARGAYVHIDRPAPRAAIKAVASVFKGRRGLVLLALWERRLDWVGVHQLAAEAEVSPATVSETLAALEKQDWVVSRGNGPTKERRLANPKLLLDAWTEHLAQASPPHLQRYFVSGGGANELLPRLDDAFAGSHTEYMVTAEAAAQVYAPYLSAISQFRCRILEGHRAIAALKHLGAKPVNAGWNLGIIFTRASGEFRFRQRDKHIWLASPLQTYLDLLQAGGRASEMAAHLRAERLDA